MDSQTVYQIVFWMIFAVVILLLPLFYFSIGKIKKNINGWIFFFGLILLITSLYFTLIINDSGQSSAWLTASKDLLKVTFTLVGSAFIAFAFIEKVKDRKKEISK